MTNSLCVRLFLPLLLIPLSTTLAKEITTTTFVILGATEHNAQKQHLALNLGIPFDKYKATTSATFTVYHASGNPVESIASFDENFVKSVENAETNRTIVISSVSTSEMSLYELNLLHEILDAVVGGVAVVEFGKESPQTTSVARNSAFCWARTRFDLLTLNRVFLCNGIDFDDIRPMISKNSLVPDSPEFVENPAQSRSLFPCFFASPTHAEKKTPSEAAAEEDAEVAEDDSAARSSQTATLASSKAVRQENRQIPSTPSAL